MKNHESTVQRSLFDALPDSAFVREAQLVQNPRRLQYPVPLPFSSATLWRKVAAGTFPKPVKLSNRVTAWRMAEVRAYLQCPGQVVPAK